MLSLVIGDLLESPTQYIAHQCNCVTHKPKGLAAQVFSRYPEADAYAQRITPFTLGTIQVVGRVINMFAQYAPGGPKAPETRATRLIAFRQCLASIGSLPDLRSITFPYYIGCDLAKGYWPDYQVALEEFARQHPQVQVILVMLPA